MPGYHRSLKDVDFLKNPDSAFLPVPKLFHYCEDKTNSTFPRIRYLTQYKNGVKICNDKGIDNSCSQNLIMLKFLHRTHSQDAYKYIIKLLQSILCQFSLFYNGNYHVDDISGSNFVVDLENFEVYLVDSDSVNRHDFSSSAEMSSNHNSTARISQEFKTKNSCQKDSDCKIDFYLDPLKAEYWYKNSLNYKLGQECNLPATSCNTITGYCENFEKLQVCIISKWMFWSFKALWPLRTKQPELYQKFKDFGENLINQNIKKRYNFDKACQKSIVLLNSVE